MKDYLLLFRGGLHFPVVSEEEWEIAMKKWKLWMDGLASQGKFSGAQRLNSNGVVLKGREKQIIDGPFAEGKEIVGGYLALKAKDFNEAVEIAKGCPIFEYEGITEVREIVSI
jgi:hypothetical protein